MKVWIVCVGEPVPSDSDNVRLRRMGLLSEKLISDGHEVEWFTASFDHYNKKQRCKKTEVKNIDKNYKIHLIKANGYKRNISFSRIVHHIVTAKNFKKIAKEQSKPDIILASMEPLEMSSVAVEYAKNNNIPVVIDIRDLWPDIFLEVLPKYLNPIIIPYVWYCRKKLSSTISKADSLIGLTDKFLDYGLKYSKREKTAKDEVFYMAYQPYDKELYKDKFDSLWGKYGLDKKDFIVTFIGNFGIQFDFSKILEAINLLEGTNIKFVLCGVGKNLEKYKQLLNNNSNVIFPGWIGKDEILSLMLNSNIGLAPYRNSINFTDNIPNKFAEYLSAGLPVFLEIEGEMKNLLEKYSCGEYYESGEQLKDLILEYAENNKLIMEKSNNCIELYEDKFNSEVVYRNMIEHLTYMKNN